MKQWLVVGVLGLLFGALLGSFVASRNLRQRSHPLAVMWLSDFHLAALRASVQAHDCMAAEQSMSRLHALAAEIPLALPKADAQERDFHRYIEQLSKATEPVVSATGSCAYDQQRMQHVETACDNCHHDYR
jgi:cytochrome c556